MVRHLKFVCKNNKCSQYWHIKEVLLVGEVDKIYCPMCGKKMKQIVYQYRDYGDKK